MTTNIGGVKIPELTYPVLTVNSEFYIDTSFFEDYVDVLGLDSAFPAAGQDDIGKQQAVYRTQVYIDSLIYQGIKYDYDQILQWPRSGVIDRNGISVDYDQTPYDIFNASAEGSLLEYNNPGVLQPRIDPALLAPISNKEVQAGSVGVKTSYDTSRMADYMDGRVGADVFTRLTSYLSQWLSREVGGTIKLVRS